MIFITQKCLFLEEWQFHKSKSLLFSVCVNQLLHLKTGHPGMSYLIWVPNDVKTMRSSPSDLYVWGLGQKSWQLFFFSSRYQPCCKMWHIQTKGQGVNYMCGQWIALKYRNTLIYSDSIQGNMAFTVEKIDSKVQIKLAWQTLF